MATSSTLSPEQRSALLAAKLRALVGRLPGVDAGRLTPGTIPGGATVSDGERGWAYLEDDAGAGIGAVLAWARRRGIAIEVVAEARAGVLARQAAAFASPPMVWAVEGTELVPATAAAFPPIPDALPEGTATLVALLEAAGVEVVVEDGQVVGEVLGLEVARVVPGDDGEPRLEVGVGRYDREVVAMLHGGVPAAESLATVVDLVRDRRSADAEPHPLNRLAPERWLRALLRRDPSLVGLDHLDPLPSIEGRRGLLETEPAAGLGRAADGAPVIVVCSVGIDLELVPAAADAHRWWAQGRDADPSEVGLVLVVPERDRHPVTTDLAGSLVVPAEVVTVPSSWRS